MQKDLSLRFFNTLGHAREEFQALEPGRVRIYTCGPTVYRFAHIGNLRSYLLADWLRRLLESLGYSVRQVKNITDVGHMRLEMLERGEDKMIAAARAEGKTPQEIAAFYTEVFLGDERKLNILPATVLPRASADVDEMVRLTRDLVDKGYAYVVQGNVYFAVSSFPGYGKLSGRTDGNSAESVRVEPDPLKRDPRDFTLWKKAEPGRALKWPSPWGDGFPGWHIECSAMVEKYLGSEIDFHTGGVDNIFPHHEDEIAQSEAALGRRHVRFWLHGEHLLVDGLKMAKSTGNTYNLSDLEARGFEPLAFRYLCAMARYRTRLNFTLQSLRAAQQGLARLRMSLQGPDGKVTKKSREEGEKLRGAFWAAAADDLNLPSTLAVAWRVARSELPGEVKRELLMDFDRLLGLDLLPSQPATELPSDLEEMLGERTAVRAANDYARADALRAQMIEAGLEVRDGRAGTEVARSPRWKRDMGTISSSGDVRSLLEEPEAVEFTVSIAAREGCMELDRCVSSVRRWLPPEPAEIIVVDNGLDEHCRRHLDEVGREDSRLKVFHADHFLGSAAGRNVSLRQARGHVIVLLDTSVEVTGDVFSRLRERLDDETSGIAGRWGVLTNDLRSFDEARVSGDVDAVEAYLMAFRRGVLREVGLLDEKYRFYRHMDLDFSFAVRSRGYRALIDTGLPVVRHEHVDWLATPEEERERLSKRNFYRFLHKWGERRDLIAVR